MIADIISNTKIYQVVTELLIRGQKLNVSLVLTTQSHFQVPNDIRLTTTYFFVMKIPNS